MLVVLTWILIIYKVVTLRPSFLLIHHANKTLSVLNGLLTNIAFYISVICWFINLILILMWLRSDLNQRWMLCTTLYSVLLLSCIEIITSLPHCYHVSSTLRYPISCVWILCLYLSVSAASYTASPYCLFWHEFSAFPHHSQRGSWLFALNTPIVIIILFHKHHKILTVIHFTVEQIRRKYIEVKSHT